MDIDNIKAPVQLVGTSIVELLIRNSVVAYNEMMQGEKSIDISYFVRDIKPSEENNSKTGILDLIIALSAKIDEQSFDLKMTMRGFFVIDAGCDDVTFKKILAINGCAALYSMARASISCISTQMFANGNVVLPLVNFIRFHELQEQEKDHK